MSDPAITSFLVILEIALSRDVTGRLDGRLYYADKRITLSQPLSEDTLLQVFFRVTNIETAKSVARSICGKHDAHFLGLVDQDFETTTPL